ncbi:MAG: hypothetical protein WCD89_25385 [Anaerocolumna sp.]
MPWCFLLGIAAEYLLIISFNSLRSMSRIFWGANTYELIKLMGFEGYIRYASTHAADVTIAKEKLYDIMIKTTPQAVITSHILLGDYSYLEVLEKTNVPITIIKNPKDIDNNKYLKKYQKYLDKNDSVKVVVFEDTGHIANIEKEEEYNDLIKKIID